MKKMGFTGMAIIFVIVIVLTPLIINFCYQEGASRYYEQNPDAIPQEYLRGLHYPQHDISLEYNGYTYQLAIVENQTGSRYSSYLYRYTNPDNKEELCFLGHGVYGLFLDDMLYYFGGGELKKINLDTLISEHVYDSKSNYFFQYGRYFYFPFNSAIMRFDINEETTDIVITSPQLDGYDELDCNTVVACSDMLWIIVRKPQGDSPVFKAELDGSNLTYAGYSISNFYRIRSAFEFDPRYEIPILEYQTTEDAASEERTIKKIYLEDGRPFGQSY